MTRILFVDDETNVLQAMRRTLHHMRNEWTMDYVEGGQAAIKHLEKTPADVIVSDMRMPGMDGWQLLAEVKVRSPQTVRLVLSGHADAASIMRAVGVAHQYIAKPCDSSALKAAITQTLSVRNLLSSVRLAELVGQIDMLPSTPKTFQDMVACLQQPGVAVSDVARVVSRDVSMTANIMKLVNSAFFGARQTISSVDRAVKYLGLDTLGALVLGHGVFQRPAQVTIEGFSMDYLWTHSMQTASAARAIAMYEKMGAAKAEQAFLTGLLHDVGRIVFATRVPGPNEPALSSEELLTQMEAHHAEVGAYLLGLWGFPSPVVEAVAYHHHTAGTTEPDFGLTVLIHIANRLAQRPDGAGLDPAELGIEAGLLERLGLLTHLPEWAALIDELGDEEERA